MSYDPFGIGQRTEPGTYDPRREPRIGATPTGSSTADIFGTLAPAAPVEQPAARGRARADSPVLPMVLLAVSVVLSVLVGAFVFAALNVIRVADAEATLATSRAFVDATIVVAVLLLATLVGHIVMRGRKHPPTVPRVGFWLTLLLPWLSLVIGLRAGVGALAAHLRADATAGADLRGTFERLLQQAGVDPGWATDLVSYLLGLVG